MFNLLLNNTGTILYILSAVCFVAFLVILIWYLISQKYGKTHNKQTKSWTIESAKKFLESNNMQVKDISNEKAKENLEEKKVAVQKVPAPAKKVQNKTTTTIYPPISKPATGTKTDVSKKTTTKPNATAKVTTESSKTKLEAPKKAKTSAETKSSKIVKEKATIEKQKENK